MPLRSAFALTLLLLFHPLLASGQAMTNHRLLILDTPTLDDPAYRTQAALLVAAWEGLIERDFSVRTRTGSKAFSLSLVGKDGGEKLRSAKPVPIDELFALVDAMPMRQRERRERAAAP